MSSTVHLGDLEQLILLAILRLGDDAYGVTIRGELSNRAGRSIQPGALYTALERLETKGMVDARMGDPTPQRGGRSKRFVKVTPAGVQALATARQAYARMLDGLDDLQGEHAT